MPETISRDSFAECLETIFRVSPAPTGHIELTLTQVSPLITTPGQETFSLLFHGPAAYPLHQGIYAFEHDRLARQEIFIVPVGRDQEGMQYEAIFNRLVP